MRVVENPIASWLREQEGENDVRDIDSTCRWTNRERYSKQEAYPASPRTHSAFSTESTNHFQMSLKISALQNEVSTLKSVIMESDQNITELQITIRNLSIYIRDLERQSQVPRNGSLGGTASDTDLTNQTPLPPPCSPRLSTPTSPRSRLNMFRDQSRSSSSSNNHSARLSDPQDVHIQTYLRQHNLVGCIHRIRNGVYRLGDGPRFISITIKNKKPLVRSGGGAYIPLEAFLSNHH